MMYLSFCIFALLLTTAFLLLQTASAINFTPKQHEVNETARPTNIRPELPEYFPGSNDTDNDLRHMIDLEKKLSSVDKKSKTSTNPYQEDLASRLY